MITKREPVSAQNTPRKLKSGQVIDLTIEDLPVRPTPRNRQLGKAKPAETIDLTAESSASANETRNGKKRALSPDPCNVEPSKKQKTAPKRSSDSEKTPRTSFTAAPPEELFGSASSERLKQIFQNDLAEALKQSSKGSSGKSTPSKSTPSTTSSSSKQAEKSTGLTQKMIPQKPSVPIPKVSEATPTSASNATPTQKSKVAQATSTPRPKLPHTSSLTSRNGILRNGLPEPNFSFSTSPEPHSTPKASTIKRPQSRNTEREKCLPRKEVRKEGSTASTPSLLDRQKDAHRKPPAPPTEILEERRRRPYAQLGSTLPKATPTKPLISPANFLLPEHSGSSEAAASADKTAEAVHRSKPAMKTATPRKDPSLNKSFLPSPSQSTQESDDETARTSPDSVPPKPAAQSKEKYEAQRARNIVHNNEILESLGMAKKPRAKKSCRDSDKSPEQLIKELVYERSENALLRKEIAKERETREKAELGRIADYKDYQQRLEGSQKRIDKLENELRKLKAAHVAKEKEWLVESVKTLRTEVGKSPYVAKTKLPALRVSRSGNFCIEDGSPSPTDSSLTELSSSDGDSFLSLSEEAEVLRRQASPEPDSEYNIKDPFMAAGGPAPYDYSSYTRQLKPAEEDSDDEAKIIFEQLRPATTPASRSGWRKSSSLFDVSRLMKVHLHKQVDMNAHRLQWQAENIYRTPVTPETGGQRRIKAEKQALAERLQEKKEIQRKLVKVLSVPEPASLVPIFKDGVLAFREGAINRRTKRLERNVPIYKVGRLIPGELR